MKSLKKRLIATVLCALLPTFNVSLGGILPDALKVNTEAMTASAAENQQAPESIFDDSLHGESDVSSDASIRNADPYGTADGQWANIFTVPEVYGLYTGSMSGASLHEIDNKNSQRNHSTQTQDCSKHLVATTGMDIGNGKDDTVASISYNESDGKIYISFSDPTTGGARVASGFSETVTTTNYNKKTGSQITTYTQTSNTTSRITSKKISGTFGYLTGIEARTSGSFLSIAAGDFDGDGTDTIITYVPEWGSPRIEEYSAKLWDSTSLDGSETYYGVYKTTDVYKHTGQHYGPNFKGQIVSNVYNEFGLQKSSVTDAEKRQRDIPIVDLVAADIDKDGRDELIVTAGLGDTCTKNKSTTKMVIYDYYNGKFNKTYTLELTGTYNQKDGRLRWASSAVGNVDVNVGASGADLPEIVTAGWVDENAIGTEGLNLKARYGVHLTKAQSLRKENDGSYTGDYSIDSNEALYAYTYSTTDKNIDLTDGENLDGISEQMHDGLHEVKYDIRNRLAVAVVAGHGAGADSQIVIGDTIYAIEDNKLKAEYVTSIDEDYSVRKILTGYYGCAATFMKNDNPLFPASDNLCEGVYFLFADENNNFYTRQAFYTSGSGKWLSGTGLLKKDDAKTYSADICNVDIDNDGMRIKLNKVTQGWGDTKPIFVLEAPPYFDELHNGKYENKGDIGSTRISNSYASGNAGSYGAGVSASVEVGVKGGLSFLGNDLEKIDVGGYFDFSFTYSGQTSVERSLEISFENNSGENTVVVARAPYYVYEYNVDGSNEKFYVRTYGNPQTAGIPIETYNKLAEKFNEGKSDDRKVLLIDTGDTNLLKLGTPGDPYSYRKDFPESDNSTTTTTMNYALSYLKNGEVPVEVADYQSQVGSEKIVTYTEGAEHGFDVDLGLGAYLENDTADVKFKVAGGATAHAGYCHFHSRSVTRSGKGANYYNEAEPYNKYNFKWNFGFWDVQAYEDEDDSPNNSKYISVLGYTVNNIKSPTVAPKDFILEKIDEGTPTFSWELPAITQGRDGVTSYKLRLKSQSGVSTEITIDPNTLSPGTDGRYRYSLSDETLRSLDNLTDYTATLSCVSAGTGWESVPSDEVKFTTQNMISFTVKAGNGLELVDGKESQKTQYSIDTVYYRIKEGYELPDDYFGESKNGISVLVNDDIISVLGSPEVETNIIIPNMKLKTYNITYNLEGGSFQNQQVIESYQLSKKKVTLPTPIQLGYEFAGWTDETGNVISTIPADTTGDRTFTATWTPSEEVAYTVNHYFMNTNGRYSIPESEVFYGKTGETVMPQPREEEGFGYPEVQSVEIANDGSTVVSYKYPREKYNLDFKDSKTASIYGTRGYYYFESFVPMEVEIEDGYYFTGWSNDRKNALERYGTDNAIDFEIPARNVTMYPLTAPCPEFGEVTLTAEDKEWDGNPVDVSINTNETDYTIEYKYYSNGSELSNVPTAVGTYTVKATLTKEKYVSKTVEKSFTISPKYGQTTYTWNKTSTGYSVTASRKCESGGKDIEETETAIYMLTQAPDFGVKGTGQYVASFKNDAFETQLKTVTVPEKTISYTRVEAKKATCSSEGNIEYYQGSDGKLYIPSTKTQSGYVETTKQAVTLAKTEHNLSSYMTGSVEPTYEKEGCSYHVTYCKDCGMTFGSTQTPIPKLERTDISSAVVSLTQEEFDYTGKNISPVFSVSLDGTELARNVDYVVSGNTAKDSGTYTLTITGKGAYEGTVSSEWTIKKQPEYSITVKNGTINGKTSGIFNKNTIVTVKSNNPENGKKFGYWTKNGSTEAISYNTSYTFKINSDIQLEAVYLNANDEFKADGRCMKDSIDIDKTNRKISFSFLNNVPENCTMVKCGIVSTSDIDQANALSLDNAMYVKEYETTTHNCKYTWTKSKVADGQAWYVKGYLIYKDQNGKETTVYSHMEKATLNGSQTILEDKVTGTAVMSSVTSYESNDTSKGTCIDFVSLLNVSADCKIKFAGVVATSDENKKENLTKINATERKDINGCFVRGTTSSMHTVQFTWTKTNVGKETWYVRPYLVYTDSLGTEQIVYGELITKTLS